MGRASEKKRVEDNISALRAGLRQDDRRAYFLPSWDEYFSEFTPAHNARLEFLTGFTGSHGAVLVGLDKALFFTDGRYIEQARQQVDGEIFTIIDIQKIKDIDPKKHMPGMSKICFNPKLFTNNYLKKLKYFDFEHAEDCPAVDYIDQIWIPRPPAPNHKIWSYDYGGKAAADKIIIIKEHLRKAEADWILLCSIDSTSWLLNLRGNSSTYTPFAQIRMLISRDEILLFTDGKLKKSPENVKIMPENELAVYLQNMDSKEKILFDPNLTSCFYESCISGVKKDSPDPCQSDKLIKNYSEIKSAVNCNIADSIALCEAFAEIESATGLTESDIDKILFRHRRARGCRMESFATIAGFRENSAIIHYRADKNNSKKIEGDGILLVDSGGHYDGGTTDVTRTLYLRAKPSQEQKMHYTLVLKGHLALARAKFPLSTTGAQLDILARQFLYNHCLDYPHSTGHGVGNFLSVHEGGAIISYGYNKPIKPGMILSNEPGYYIPGQYGIRIENLMYCREFEKCFLQFENLTLVPYCATLINVEMLNSTERSQIKVYYQKINDLINHHLSSRGNRWLDAQMGDM